MDLAQFKDRQTAAQLLAARLKPYQSSDTIILGIPRGGIVTAAVIAQKLSFPLGLIVIRKISHPDNPEYAVAAITESGQIIKNEAEVAQIDPRWFTQESNRQLKEAQRRRLVYWKNKAPLVLKNKTVIIVDDGLATGLTMLAAIKEVKLHQPQKIIVAVPVSPRDTAAEIKPQVDDFIALSVPEIYLGSVGAYYENFPQLEDQAVINTLTPNSL